MVSCTASKVSGSSDATTEAAVASPTSCSQLRPPPMTATRVRGAGAVRARTPASAAAGPFAADWWLARGPFAVSGTVVFLCFLLCVF